MKIRMAETTGSQEVRKEILSHQQFLEKVLQMSSYQGVILIRDILKEKIQLGNITPDDAQWIKDNRGRLSTFKEWVITVAQVPRLRNLVKQGFLSPEEAVASLRAFENYFFEYGSEKSDGTRTHWGPNYATRHSIPAYIREHPDAFPPEIKKIIERVAKHPEELFLS
ncbi:MAG: hypothetical protein ABIK90_03505 [candidate division WOR-3 bacterium]